MVIYKTTNLINGAYYIGKDSHNDPDYLGSGKILKLAFKKYGRHNFKKEILEYCTDMDHLNEREVFWIRESNCQLDENSYNIGSGGEGGDNITFHPDRQLFVEKMTKINRESNGMTGKKHRSDTILKQKEKSVGRYTLQWFIDRYGVEVGTEKYNDRNTNLSTSRTGPNNSAYIHVDRDDLFAYIISNPNCKLVEVCSFFNVSQTCLYNKFRLYYQRENLRDVKRILLMQC